MVNTAKIVIVTGGSQGIGAGVERLFLDRDYNVVATSRNVTKSRLAFVAEARLGGWRYWGRPNRRKSGKNCCRRPSPITRLRTSNG
jgi:NAD(P)-dependent dehydrogenase (short-subunit alcohol dehydrogenase family)